MKVIVNDANILIDLVELKILPYFFKLDVEFRTTELILVELIEEQQEALLPYIETGRLLIEKLSEEELVEIAIIQASKTKLSEQDCSACYQALKHKATLITSDNVLRKFAKSKNIDVHGHLWVFDNLYQQNIISGTRATKKLNQLCNEVNPKLGLPKAECTKRIEIWNKNQ
jgi:predicted nucleic acid-binding protein